MTGRDHLLLAGGLMFALTGQGAEPVALNEAVTSLLAEFQAAAPEPLSAEAGRATWYQDTDGRSCTSCHSETLDVAGRHEKTGKPIEPMAPSVNPERLADRRKINKWFLRNCKWTFGRECTAQEKGDMLLWLSQQ